MKNIILILFSVFAYLVGFSQPVVPRSSDVITVQDGNLFAKNSFRPAVYLDTTAANLVISLDSCGKIIFTYSGNTFWERGCNPKRWIKVINQTIINDTSTAIRNNIYWQLDANSNLTNKTFAGNNIEPFKFMKIVQPGFTGSQFDGWPGNYATAFNKNILGIYGDEPSLDILIDSSSQFNIGGITFRSSDGIVPRLPASRFGASAGAKIEYNAFVNGGDSTSTIEFFLGDQDATTIHVAAFSGPGVHFYGNRKVATWESKEALMFGTAINGVNSAAISGLDTTMFTGDAGGYPMYIFNMRSAVMDTNTYKPIVYNTLTGEWGRSTWPQTGGGGAGSVTSVATNNGTGITGGTITTTGTLAIDTGLISTRAWRQKGVDSLNVLLALKLNISDTATMLNPYLRKTDTTAMLSPYLRKLLGSGQIFVGNGSNIATGVSPSGDIASISTAGAFTIANNAVTYAKFQQVAGSRLLGNPTGSTANVSEIGLGFGAIFNSNLLKADTARKSGLPTYYYVDSAVAGGVAADTTYLKPPLYAKFGTKDTVVLNYPTMTPTEDGRLDFARVYLSNAGSDANDGYGPLTPKLTIGAFNTAVNNESLANGSGYGVFKVNDINRAMVDLTADSISVGAYGLKSAEYLHLPILSGADVHNSGWTLDGGASFRYSKNITLSIGSNFGYDYPIVIEIDTLLEKTSPYTARKYLQYVANTTLVESTAGSFHNANLTNPVTIYIHASDGSAPGSNRYRYEVAVRRNAISASTSLATMNIQRVILRDAGGGYGVIGAATGGGARMPYVAHTVMQGAGTHLVVSQGGTYEYNVFLSSVRGLTSGSIAGAFYKDTGTAIYGDLNQNIFLDQVSAWTAHEGAPASKLERVRYRNNYYFSDTTFSTTVFGCEFVKRLDITGNYVEQAQSAFVSAADTFNVIGNVFRYITNTSLTATSTAVKSKISNNVWVFTPPSSGLTRTMLQSMQTTDSFVVDHNTFHLISENDQAESVIALARTSAFSGPTPTSVRYNIFIGEVPATRYAKIVVTDQNSTAGVTAGYDADYNVYILVSGAGFQWTLLNPNGGGNPNCFTLTDWQTRSGRDANSIFIDLTASDLSQVFVDHENGNWTLRNTTEGNQVRALLAGPTNPPRYYPARPSYEQAVETVLNGNIQSGMTSQWQNSGFGGTSGSGGITQLTGDGTAGPGSGSQAFTLASVISAGSCTNCSLTWDVKGRITVAGSGASSSAHLLAGNAYTGTDKLGATNLYTLPIIVNNANMGFFRYNQQWLIGPDSTGITAGIARLALNSNTTLGGFMLAGTTLATAPHISMTGVTQATANSQHQSMIDMSPTFTNPGAFTNPQYHFLRGSASIASANIDIAITNSGASGTTSYSAADAAGSHLFTSGGMMQNTTGGTWRTTSASNLMLIQVGTGVNRVLIDSSGMNIGDFTRPAARLAIRGNKGQNNWGLTGIQAAFVGATYTDLNSTGTVTHTTINAIGQSTLASLSASTHTNASTLYIANAPAAGTNATLTNAWALYIAAGKSFHAGEFNIGSATDNGAFTLQNTGGLFQSGAVKLDLGSDATGDTYYRDGSGNFVRRAIGTSGQVWTVSGGLPVWADATGGGGDTTEVTPPLYVVSGTKDTLKVRYDTTTIYRRASDSALTAITLYSANSTLAGNRIMDGNSNSLSLGQNSSRLSSMQINSAGLIQLFGLVQFNSENSTDADYTVSDRAGVVRLTTITTNRVVTLPPQGSGKFLIIWNENSSGNNWSFSVSTGNVVDAAGTTITNLTNDAVYILASINGNYVKLN